MADCSAVGTTVDRAARAVLGAGGAQGQAALSNLMGHAASSSLSANASMQQPRIAPTTLTVPSMNSVAAATAPPVAALHPMGPMAPGPMLHHPQQQTHHPGMMMHHQQQQHQQQMMHSMMMQQQQQQQQVMMNQQMGYMIAQQQQHQLQQQQQAQSAATKSSLLEQLQEPISLENWHDGLEQHLSLIHI